MVYSQKRLQSIGQESLLLVMNIKNVSIIAQTYNTVNSHFVSKFENAKINLIDFRFKFSVGIY